MKIGIIRNGDTIVRAVWCALPSVAKIALLAKYGKGAPLEVTLGDLVGSAP